MSSVPREAVEWSLDTDFAAGRAALRQVYDAHGPLVYSICRRLLDAEAADQATRAVFLAAWRSREGYRPEHGPLQPWIVAFARRRLTSALAKRGGDPDSSDDGSVDQIADRMLLAAGLRRLPDDQRHLIELAFVEGLTHHEIAERCSIPIATVDSEIRSGLVRSRPAAGQRAPGPPGDRNERDDGDFARTSAEFSQLGADDVVCLVPPDEVWKGIVRVLADNGETSDPRAVTNVTSTPPLRTPTQRRERLERRPRSLRSARPMLFATAAAVLAVAAVAAYGLTHGRGSDTVATSELEFDAATYDPLGETAVASVRLVSDGGVFGIEFDEASLPASELADEQLELWLARLDPAGTPIEYVSLGVVDDIDRRYTVPDDLDPAEFDVVDISVEPIDNVPEHSHRTILRGRLSN